MLVAIWHFYVIIFLNKPDSYISVTMLGSSFYKPVIIFNNNYEWIIINSAIYRKEHYRYFLNCLRQVSNSITVCFNNLNLECLVTSACYIKFC